MPAFSQFLWCALWITHVTVATACFWAASNICKALCTYMLLEQLTWTSVDTVVCGVTLLWLLALVSRIIDDRKHPIPHISHTMGQKNWTKQQRGTPEMMQSILPLYSAWCMYTSYTNGFPIDSSLTSVCDSLQERWKSYIWLSLPTK